MRAGGAGSEADWMAAGAIAAGAALVLGPALLLFAAGCGLAWRGVWRPAGLRRFCRIALGGAMALAGLAAASLLIGPPAQVLPLIDGPGPWDVELFWDPLAALVLLLVVGLGLVVGSFSLRQLAGEPGQVRFLQWLLWTLASTALLVVAGNLWLFALAWMLTSLGLHQLLTFYPERPWAIWAARKKFLISRLGDLLLLGALAAVYAGCGTWSYSALFALARDWEASAAVPALIGLAGVLFALAAMTKSAQVPFHSWLPDTMETPTPVSALMHAGVINAGGYLILRLSPLVSWSAVGMHLLVLVGGLTALVAGVVMMTQTSLKRGLAYSTIAQMGFMLLQCGCGAYAAAVLHLLAHSLYKAYAFLGSGSVLQEAAAGRVRAAGRGGRGAVQVGIVAGGSAVGLVAGVAWLAGYDLLGKPSAAVLGLVLILAVSQLLRRAFAEADLATRGWGLLRGLGVCGLYFGGVAGLEWLLAESFRGAARLDGGWSWAVVGVVAVGFIGVFLLQLAIENQASRAWLHRWYVHAANGFYLDIPVRHLTARVWGRPTPTP